MNETLKVLETRRSCRNFKPDMVSKEELDAILRAGTYAATGMGTVTTGDTTEKYLGYFSLNILRVKSSGSTYIVCL